MKTPHTPAPWKVEKHDGSLEVWSVTEHIAVIPPSIVANRPANAHLIAAAPEMLAALKNLLELTNIVMKKDGSSDCSIRQAARDAIRRAGGAE